MQYLKTVKQNNISCVYYVANGLVFETSVGVLKDTLNDQITVLDSRFLKKIKKGHYSEHHDSPYAEFTATDTQYVGVDYDELNKEQIELLIELSHDEYHAEAICNESSLVYSWEQLANGNFFLVKTIDTFYGKPTIPKYNLFIFHKYDMPKDKGRWHCVEFRGNGEASLKEMYPFEMVQSMFNVGNMVLLVDFVAWIEKQGVISLILFEALKKEFELNDLTNLIHSKLFLTNGKN